MCKLKSVLVLKDRIFCPDYDSHDWMLEELGIKDTEENAETRFVRVELSPADGDVFSSVDGWKLTVDQDIIPDWFFAELEEPKIRAAVKAWAAEHIFDGACEVLLNGGGIYYLKNSTAELCGNSTATLWGNSTAELRENSTGRIPDDSFGGRRDNYVLMDNSTLKDYKTKTIYQAGGWNYVEVTR